MLIRCIWLHFVLYSPLAELKQLRKGLFETLQFKHLVDNYAKEVWRLLAASNMYEITPKFLCDSFVVEYSFNGSNNRTQEENIVFSWYEYISDCADRDDTSVGDVLTFLLDRPRFLPLGLIQFQRLNLLMKIAYLLHRPVSCPLHSLEKWLA